MAFFRFSVMFFFVVGSLAIDGRFPSDGWRSEKEVRNIHQSWVAEHGKTYTNAEEEKRFNIFSENLKYIEEHNNKTNSPYKLGLTVFADLTNEEYVNYHLGKTSVPPVRRMAAREIAGKRTTLVNGGDGLPEKVDWREKNAVTPVKDQDICGACWAFVVVAAIEGIHKIKKGTLVSFSEQQLIDCDTENQGGCKYGYVQDAFDYLSKNKVALHTDSDYPYADKQQKCSLPNKSNKTVVRITGWADIPQDDELALKKAVARQPCTATLETTSKAFQLYRSGVLTGECGSENNHAAAVIGYGTENGIDYWLLKNSWGPKWGENGFFKLQRNVKDEYGKCGITVGPAYPLLN